METKSVAVQGKRLPKKRESVFKRFWKTRFLFVLWLPTLIHTILFHYVPMWGVSLSFFDYNIWLGWEGSDFVGLQNFRMFFENPMWWKLTRNTLILGLQHIFIAFPITILFSLLLNEIRSMKFKKVVQTVSYMPHFMSTVVVIGLMTQLLDPVTGGINTIIKLLGGEPIYFLIKEEWFRPLYLIEDLWKGLGWGTIVFLAAISNVDPSLYEAARLDGAGRFRQMWSITLPAIAPTTATLFILRVGGLLSGSLEKTLLMQQPITYEVSDIIATYVYRVGLVNQNYGYASAVGLFTNVVNLAMVLIANWACKKMTNSGIF